MNIKLESNVTPVSCLAAQECLLEHGILVPACCVLLLGGIAQGTVDMCLLAVSLENEVYPLTSC